MELLSDEYRILKDVIRILRSTTLKECQGKKLRSLLERKIREEFLFNLFPCSRCKEWLEKKEYSCNKSKLNGISTWCLGCCRLDCKTRYWKDPDKSRARNRVLYKQAYNKNPEAYKKKNRRNR